MGSMLTVKRSAVVLSVIIVASLALIIQNWFIKPEKEQDIADATLKLPNFELKDTDGETFCLSSRRETPVLLHFMTIGCGGQYAEINDYQIRQLLHICDEYCTENGLDIVTITVTSCTTSDLKSLKNKYNMTWVIGNDYDDNKLDIIEAYKEYELYDGTIIIGTSGNRFHEIFREKVSSDTLIEKLKEIT